MIVVVIPAFEPPPTLLTLTLALLRDPHIVRILVVDDGSSARVQTIFQQLAQQPRTTVLRHDRNQGKGAALKTAFRYIVETLSEVSTVVTADADGQHLAADILSVGAAALTMPGALVVGVRDVGPGAPARSWLGNRITRTLYRCVIGQQLSDTQSGLRAFPASLLDRLAAADGEGYEYELNVLIWCRQSHVPLVERPIRTIYLDRNRHSHFRPLRDSWRVYSVLFRFTSVSLASAAIDNLAFLATLAAGVPEASGLLLARLLSSGVNYPLVCRFVFPGSNLGSGTLGPYLILLTLNILAGRLLLASLGDVVGLSTLQAKIVLESLFFLPNFLLQRDVVFRPAAPAGSSTTDWTSYYASVPMTARWTRRYTSRVLVRALRDAARVCGPSKNIAELGGANSCFLDHVCGALQPDSYLVVDSNPFGLSRLAAWTPPAPSTTKLTILEADVRAVPRRTKVDTVFSVGLIEHFDPADTRKVLGAHFDLVRSGGTVLVSYPTPTLLYRVARRMLEFFRLWRFPDERPVRFLEVERAASPLGHVLSRRTIWPVILTQEMVVFQKR
jgi:hypothetical protein